MCGILGLIENNAQSATILHTLRKMGQWQSSRGPDAWGEWAVPGVGLGHNRLAILDIAGGRQPMSSLSGNIHIVFNGEIYNYRALWRELEQKGYRFCSDHSDTEVILNGYTEWGADLFRRLDGMFAFAIWDQRTSDLVLARDRLGIKPLYYADSDGRLIFASEPKTILASSLIDREMDSGSLISYFLHRGPRYPKTLLTGIKAVPPGVWLTYGATNGSVVGRRFWSPAAEVRNWDIADAEECIASSLTSAVKSHCVADVPVGVFLSGGVDSSLIAALLPRDSGLHAFTIGLQSDLDETPFAAKVAQHLGIPLHPVVLDGKGFRNFFEEWCYVNDDPVADPSALALMALAEHVQRSGVKVVLSGDGADELFGGYNSYLRYDACSRVTNLCITASLRKVVRQVAGFSDVCFRPSWPIAFLGTGRVADLHTLHDILHPDLRVAFVNVVEEQISAALEVTSPHRLREAMLLDQLVRLPCDILARTDRATMAFSVEARVPYLDHHVVELANSLPDDLCVRLPLRSKWLLKRIAARYLPRDVVYRRKRGFDLPLAEWISTNFRDLIENHLSSRQIQYLDYRALGHIWGLHGAGHLRNAGLLWAWLVLEEWHRLWVRGEAVPRRSQSPVVMAEDSGYCSGTIA